MCCVTRAGLVPFLGARPQMYCENHADLVPHLGVRLQLYCVTRAGLVPLLGVRLHIYILVLGMATKKTHRVYKRSLSVSGICKPGVALPQGSDDFTTIVTGFSNAPPHTDRPGRSTSMIQRDPSFFGCGSVCTAGINHVHSNASAKDGAHVPVSFVLLLLGFSFQARTASHVAAASFTGSTWEGIIAVLMKHYAPADHFANGGGAPLL